jgi:hypothetical protein
LPVLIIFTRWIHFSFQSILLIYTERQKSLEHQVYQNSIQIRKSVVVKWKIVFGVILLWHIYWIYVNILLQYAAVSTTSSVDDCILLKYCKMWNSLLCKLYETRLCHIHPVGYVLQHSPGRKSHKKCLCLLYVTKIMV